MNSSDVNNRNITVSMKKSVENLVISSQDAIGQSISQALTFSGVISQHATQIINENKSVSRSPSPAFRNAEGSGTELADSDKSCESVPHMSLSPPSDAISFCSLVVDASGRSDDKRGSARVAESRKKKSWYASLYPTYKSKSDDFKRLFKDLPDDERLIVDYSCALQKEILAHGRLYASQNYLCFHASIFGWETTLSLRWKDVTAITKEKTALVIPNAILVCTDEEKNFLTSFSGRDKAYLMLFRIWQNALMDQPMSSQEIWQWVHTCYGEELGFNSDDEGYSRDFADDSTGNNPEELLDSSSAEVGGGEERRSASRQRDSATPPPLQTPLPRDQVVSHYLSRSRRTRSAMNTSEMQDDEEFVIVEDPSSPSPWTWVSSDAFSGVGDVELEAADNLPTDMSDTSDSEPNTAVGAVAPKCTSEESHNGRLMMKQQYAFNIDQLFTMMFTNSKFNLELLAARGIRDYVQAQWQPQNGLDCRQVSYVMGLTTGPIGPKEVQVTETQVMNKCSKPGVLYSIDSTCENAGIPYADYFSVKVHYCMYRIAEDVTELQLYQALIYKKQAWGVVKGFLEKNTAAGLDEFSRILHSKLTSEASPPPATRHVRRRRRAHQTMGSGDGKTGAAPTALLVPRTSVSAPTPAASNFWLWAILLVLLAINVLLYYQLVYVERHTYDLDDLQTRLSSLSDTQTSVWARLLEEHRSRQTHQLRAWRESLATAVTHLEQTERALSKLLESIKPTLDKHQEEHNEL